MAKISTTKKIAIEEFPKEVRGWIGKLINPINKFMEQSYFAISKGLTLRDNVKSQVFNIDIVVSQTYPIKVSWTLNERPTAVSIGYMKELPNGGTIPVHTMQWEYNSDGKIEITFNGLESSKAYKATIVGQV
jgi:hypothetical protein